MSFFARWLSFLIPFFEKLCFAVKNATLPFLADMAEFIAVWRDAFFFAQRVC